MAKSSSPYSFDNFINVVNENFTIFLMVGLTFIAGFAVGSLYERGGGSVRLADSGSAGQEAAPSDNAPAAPSGPSDAKLSEMPEVTEDDWVRGAEDAPITLVEYSDYNCPFCERFHNTMNEIIADNEGQVRWVYRHFPLDNIHPEARGIAYIAECVGREAGEEAFWTFTDRIFEEQEGMTQASSIELAVSEFGLDAGTLESCAEEDSIQQKVEDDVQGGSAAGVTGTPGTIVVTNDGEFEFLPGAVPATQVQSTIDGLL